MTTSGKPHNRGTFVWCVCALFISFAIPPSAAVAQTCEREAEDPCCSHLTGQNVACIENCGGSWCCWLPDNSIMTVLADDVLYATGQIQIQYLVWDDRCRYKAPNCSTGSCTHPGPYIYRDCIIAEPNPDDCPAP